MRNAMKRPKSSERRLAAGPGSRSLDETMIDITRPAGPGSAGQQAGRSALQVSIATDMGRVRRNNEDYVQAERVVRDGRRYSLWVVADGVGGGPKGELASKTAVETIVDYLVHEPWTDPAVALTEAFAIANRNVFEITGEGSAASTMVAALVSEPEGLVSIANVGDSRAYTVAGGEARQITDDHSIVAARVAAGQITAAEARTAPDRNVLTRSIGSETETLVDIFGPRQLLPNERLVFCTDGVHGMIDDAMLGRLGGGLPIAESAGALVKAAVEAGGKDNATALVGGYGAGAAIAAGVAAGSGATSAVGRMGHRRASRTVVLASAGLLGLALVILLGLVVFGASSTASPSVAPTPILSPTPIATKTKPVTPPTTLKTPTKTAAMTPPLGAQPTPAPVMTATVVGAPPGAAPGNGTFTVTSLPLASCTLTRLPVLGDPTPRQTTVPLDGTGSADIPWGQDWKITKVTVVVVVTCIAPAPDHRSATSAPTTVQWP
jgi:serine/threonine protein phosphatase PrpC